MLPAYGVGGILNGYFVRRGRELALADAMREIEASESESETGAGSEGSAAKGGGGESAIEAFGSGERLDLLDGRRGGRGCPAHARAGYLYGDNSVHPIAMAKETSLPEMTFRWERMIQNTVQAQLADAGGGGHDRRVHRPPAATPRFPRRWTRSSRARRWTRAMVR